MRKFKKVFITLFLISIFCSMVFILVDEYVCYVGEKYMIELDEEMEEIDAVIVLGSKVMYDGTPSVILQDRLNTAYKVYENGTTDRILVSGDHGRVEYDEVNGMRRFLEDKDVPTENIFMDHAGFSTYESMYRAKEIFCVDKAIIVTQEYHLKRALFIARTLGIEAYGVASDIHQYPRRDYYEFREKAARVKDFFKSHLKLKPTYLGQIIPIWEDGYLTH